MNQKDLDLLHRYLDGAITKEEFESLEGLLRESTEARATLRSLATIDAKWQEIADNRPFGTNTMQTGGTDNRDTKQDQHPAQVSGSPGSRRTIPTWLTFMAIAASLMIGVVGWFRASDESITEQKPDIARVIHIEGEGNVGKDRQVIDGAKLFAGESITMECGLIELAFQETGVHVVATAPLRMKLDSHERVSLHEGQGQAGRSTTRYWFCGRYGSAEVC